MRDLWTALTLMADNTDGILDELKKIADTEDTGMKEEVELGTSAGDTRKMFMKQQPSFPTLRAIHEVFVKHGLYLAAYELAEINRWLCDDRIHQGKSMAAVKEYWEAIKAAGVDTSNKSLQQAAGAMAIDGKLRFEFADPDTNLRKFGFDVDEEEQQLLRNVVATNQPADLAAQRFFEFSWPGSTCGGIMVPYPGWWHVNL